MGYIFANQEAKKSVLMSKVCGEDYVAGSDHRMLCCTTSRGSSQPKSDTSYHQPAVRDGNLQGTKKDTEDAHARAAVERKLEERSKEARAAVIKELGPLLHRACHNTR